MHLIPTLIVGGGLAGASLACSLAEREAGVGVSVADVDLFGKYSASECGVGDVQIAPGGPPYAGATGAALLKLSIVSARFFLENAFRFDYRVRGTVRLFGADGPQGRDAVRAVAAALRAAGLRAEEFTPGTLRERFSFIGPTADFAGVEGALFTPSDGQVSPHKVRMHYLNRAQAGGVELMDRWQVVRVESDRAPFEVTLRQVAGRGVKKTLTDETATSSKAAGGASAAELTVRVGQLVNAAGPCASRVARLYGCELPVTPSPRQVFLIRSDEVDFESLPAFVDGTQGLTFAHHERDRKSHVRVTWNDPPASGSGRIDYTSRDEAYYREQIAPRLVRRAPALSGAPVVGAWVGHDDQSADGRPVLGPVAGRAGLFNYNGLSGRGVAWSRGLGEAMAVRLLHGRWPIGMNLDELTDARSFAGRPG